MPWWYPFLSRSAPSATPRPFSAPSTDEETTFVPKTQVAFERHWEYHPCLLHAPLSCFFSKPHALGLRRKWVSFGSLQNLSPNSLSADLRDWMIGGLPRQLGNAGTKAGAWSLLIASESSRVCTESFRLCSLCGGHMGPGRGRDGGLLVRAWVMIHLRQGETVQGPDVIWKNIASPNQSSLLKMKR